MCNVHSLCAVHQTADRMSGEHGVSSEQACADMHLLSGLYGVALATGVDPAIEFSVVASVVTNSSCTDDANSTSCIGGQCTYFCLLEPAALRTLHCDQPQSPLSPICVTITPNLPGIIIFVGRHIYDYSACHTRPANCQTVHLNLSCLVPFSIRALLSDRCTALVSGPSLTAPSAAVC